MGNNGTGRDEWLIARAKQGDVEATGALLAKYRSVVLFKSRSYFLHGAERDDMIQEGIVGLYKAIRDYRLDRTVRSGPSPMSASLGR